MKAYIQSHENGIPHNYNFMNAYQGFYEMGFEVIPFHDNERFQESIKEDIVVGYDDYEQAIVYIPIYSNILRNTKEMRR